MAEDRGDGKGCGFSVPVHGFSVPVDGTFSFAEEERINRREGKKPSW